MLKIRAGKLREIRSSKGWSRRVLAQKTGIFAGQIGKMERGEIVATSRHKIAILAEVLDVPEEMIATSRDKSDAEKWAEYNGLSHPYALELAGDGRIEGAYKDADGRWRMARNARKLPPTEITHERWRERWQRYGASYQRARRDKRRGNGEDGDLTREARTA